eukprot:4181509-Prymnesium_polylepis.1
MVELPALDWAHDAEHEELNLARDRAKVHRGVRRRAQDVKRAVARPLRLEEGGVRLGQLQVKVGAVLHGVGHLRAGDGAHEGAVGSFVAEWRLKEAFWLFNGFFAVSEQVRFLSEG